MSNKEREIWSDIEAEYTTSDKTLQKLADEFKVSYATLRNKAADNKWSDKRRAYMDAEVRAEELRRKQSASKEKGAFDDALIRISKLSVMKCAVNMTRATMQDSDGNMIDVAIDTKALKENLAIARDAQEILYRVWDVPLPSKVTIDDNRDKSPAESLDDEIALAVDGLLIAQGDDNGNSNGNGNGNGETKESDSIDAD